MEALREQVVAVVVLALFLVGLVPVAGVEALGQEQEAADPVAVLGEVGRVVELVCVALGVVGPDVLDLVAVPPAPLDVLGEVRRPAGGRLDVVGHAR